MSTYQVNSELITTASAGVHRSIGIISSEVASLMGQLRNLQGSWTGAAHNAFASVAEQWQSTQQQVETCLTQINAALAAAGSTYAAAEDQAMRLFATG
ncbi:MAG: WXG100 family type VII secretion target [Micrococcales bacterium]|nr:WXG100 family type VII secretion target [Micrococcales bacterium]